MKLQEQDLISEFEPSLLIFKLDSQRRILDANETALQTISQTIDDIKGLRIDTILSIPASVFDLKGNTPVATGRVTLLPSNLEQVVLEGTLWKHDATNNADPQITLALHDLTHLYKTMDNLDMLAKVFNFSNEAIMITNSSDTIIAVNPAFTRNTGYLPEETIGRTPDFFAEGLKKTESYDHMWQIIHTHGHWKGEVWNRRKSGERVLEWLSVTAIHGASKKIENYISIFSEITQQRINEEHLIYQAQHDFLTGLPNRILLQDRFNQAKALSRRDPAITVSVLFADLDGFKAINDIHGHAAGDFILIEAAKRFKRCVRSTDTVCRYGGDEFVILSIGARSVKDLDAIARKIRQAICKPFKYNNTPISVGISVGGCFPLLGPKSLEAMLKTADKEMYKAKKSDTHKISIS